MQTLALCLTVHLMQLLMNQQGTVSCVLLPIKMLELCEVKLMSR